MAEWSFFFIRCLSLEQLLVSTKQLWWHYCSCNCLSHCFSYWCCLDLIGFSTVAWNCLTQEYRWRRISSYCWRWNTCRSYYWYVHGAPTVYFHYLWFTLFSFSFFIVLNLFGYIHVSPISPPLFDWRDVSFLIYKNVTFRFSRALWWRWSPRHVDNL